MNGWANCPLPATSPHASLLIVGPADLADDEAFREAGVIIRVHQRGCACPNPEIDYTQHGDYWTAVVAHQSQFCPMARAAS